MVIPTSLFNKEKEHIEGFAPECLGRDDRRWREAHRSLIIRPTSEILFSDLYKRLVSSYRDLPKMYNQWCSVVRWEKTTRPFLRGSRIPLARRDTVSLKPVEEAERT
jgi:prolyl-tRNA synthetase